MLRVIYRISDTGYNKVKPSYINNEQCLRNAVDKSSVVMADKTTWTFIADNVSEGTFQMIHTVMQYRYIDYEIHRVSVGNGAGTFNIALDKALEYDDNDVIYFLENDYIHKPLWDAVLLEGIEVLGADYVSLYDHPDKYIPASKGGNPLIGEDGGEETKVFLTNSCHWKLTNSTTMTFAAKVSTLKRDELTLTRWTTIDGYPRDFDMFMELRSLGRSLITPLPAWATHGESAWLSPLYDWESFVNKIKRNDINYEY